MALISNENNLFCTNHFVFSGNDILLENGKLPEENSLRHFLECNISSDWFAEPELDYSAMMLEDDAPVPSSCTFIPLRQYFYEHKDKTSGLAARAHSLLLQRQAFRFCPSCGTKLEDHTHFTAKFCPSCQKMHFPRIEPCVIVLVKKEDEFLLVKNRNYARQYYALVAGFVEQGETLEEGAAREVLEETGIKIRNIRYHSSQTWPFPDQLMVAFTADYESGEIKIQEEELTDAQWFKKDSLPNLPPEGSVAWNLIHSELGDLN